MPGIPAENYWFRRHEAAYDAIVPFCPGAVVLEAGCGEGYGADRLAEVARVVLGLDYDAAAVGHVAAAYPRVAAVRANVATLPVRDGSVDVVASLQVIEHLWDQPAFLAECRRVLRPAGTLLVTTPNRLTFTLPNRPMNPFHYRELDPDALATLLEEAGFEITRLLGLRQELTVMGRSRRHRHASIPADGRDEQRKRREEDERWVHREVVRQRG